MSRRYRFVSHHSGPDLPAGQRHRITQLCDAVGVGRGGYYAWQAAEPARAAKASAEQALTGRIRRIHQDSRCTYGAKRVALDLADGTDGQPPTATNHKKVARLMRQHGIEGRHLRRRRSLTRQDKTAAPAPDLLGRDFAAAAPNIKWCGDITYIPVGETGFVYLATVIDLFSGRLVGWSIADHHRAELVTDALTAAVAARGGAVDGVIFHSDRGSEYTSALVADYCRGQGIRRSMGRVGSCFDNAAAESFFASYKRGDRHHLGHRPLRQRGRSPPRNLPLDRLLQPPPPTQPGRATRTHRLRGAISPQQ